MLLRVVDTLVVSAVLSVAAFGLVFALPRAVDPSRLDDV